MPRAVIFYQRPQSRRLQTAVVFFSSCGFLWSNLLRRIKRILKKSFAPSFTQFLWLCVLEDIDVIEPFFKRGYKKVSVFLLLLFFQVLTSFMFFSEKSTHHDTSSVRILCYYDKYFLNNCFKSFHFCFLLQVFSFFFFSKRFPNHLSHFSELFLMISLWIESRSVILSVQCQVQVISSEWVWPE